jgi:hypothetical protein
MMQTTRTRLLIAAALAVALALIWLKPLDTIAERHVETGFQRALTTFAVARTLNAVFSVIESTSVGVQVGVGGSVHPGAVLEPLDDLVEQFSDIMLLATLSFAGQALMLNVAGAWPVSVLLTVVLLAWGLGRAQGKAMSPWLPQLALGLLCLRLSVPMLALASEATYQLVFARDYTTSQTQIEIARIPDNDVRPDESFTERAKRWWAQSTEINQKIEALKAQAEALVEHVIRLSAIFIVQTAVLPLLFFWGLLWVYRALAKSTLVRQAEPMRLEHDA